MNNPPSEPRIVQDPRFATKSNPENRVNLGCASLEYYTVKSPEIRSDYLQESARWLRIGLLSHGSTELRIPVNEVQEVLSLSYGIRKTPPSSGAFLGELVEMVGFPKLCGTPQHGQIHLKLA